MTRALEPPYVSWLIGLALLPFLVVVGRISRRWTSGPAGLATLLAGRWAPWIAGAVTFGIVRFVWGSLAEPGIVHDERAYLLQAAIFAHGHWTAPSPPIPAFFEQMHVFVEPAVFAKYPPGHALTLVPGIWFGLPGLMPALLAGLAGASIYWLARRVSNTWTALLTWFLWTTSPAVLIWATTYFSESTSLVMWLAAVCATLLWHETGRVRYLFLVSAALAWGFETRPLTMIALASPLMFVIVRRVVETGGWRSLVGPVLAGALVLAIGPLWNHRTLGGWLTDPYPVYSRTYFPFDKPGFGVETTPPLRSLPSQLAGMDAWSRDVHRSYVPAAVPAALAQRTLAVLITFGEGWRLALVLLLLASFVRIQSAVVFSAVACASLLGAYLVFAQPPEWVVYYVELLPMLHFMAAVALVRLLAPGGAADQRRVAIQANLGWAATIVVVALVPLCAGDLTRVRARIDRRNAFHRQADQLVRRAPPHSILFVRYGSTQSPHFAITRNEPDLAEARSWVVYDRGADNDRLAALAPDRKVYVLDMEALRLEPLRTPSDY